MKKLLNVIGGPSPITDLEGVRVDLVGLKNVENLSVQETNDRLIKKFSKKVRKSEIVKEYLATLRFVKPSQQKHEKDRKVQFINWKKQQFDAKKQFIRGKNQE